MAVMQGAVAVAVEAKGLTSCLEAGAACTNALTC
jgi:hypothetical protein